VNEAAGQKKFFKVKYLSGAISYGAKIHSGACVENYIEICKLHLLGAFSRVQGAFFYITIVSIDFTLKNFSGLLHFTGVDRN
jgi:hypothetical protein